MNLDEIKKKIIGDGNTVTWDVDNPNYAYTMLPVETLNNIEYSINECVKNGVEGDFVETGVWRGGGCILAHQVLKKLNQNRKVYVYDSFEGLPKPDASKYPVDRGDNHWTIPHLAVSLEEVKNNFKAFGELDDNVVFVKGFFKDTMPTNEIDKISVLRLDGDMYESTIDVLEHLYPKLSKGGYCIIDDFGHKGAKAATMDYRNKHNITDEIVIIDPTPGAYPSSYWVKS